MRDTMQLSLRSLGEGTMCNIVGFGTRMGGGCTSGHGVMGLAAREVASLIAVYSIFAGGVLATFVVLPLLF